MKDSLATLGLFVLVACGGGEDAGAEPERKEVKLAFVTNGVSDFWVIAQAGAQAGAEAASSKLGVDVDVDVLMPAAGITEQKRMIEDLVTRGVDGIAVSPIDPANQIDTLNRAAEATKLITHDSDAPGSDRLCYVGLDNYEAGKLCAELVQDALPPEGGEVHLFIGRLEQDNGRRRRQGLIDELLGREDDPARFDPPGQPIVGERVTVLGTLTDQGDFSKAKANVEDVLSKHPDVDVLVGLFAYNPPLILEALKQAGKLGQITVVGFDEADETLDGILEGTVIGTIVQDPYEYGHRSIEILAALVEGVDAGLPAGDREDCIVEIPARQIRAPDVEAFRADLDAKLKRSDG